MAAVSAPNPQGLVWAQMKKLIHFYRELCLDRQQKPLWGLYEFNPLYDDVSGRGARVISSILYEMLL
jgi:formiminoglutamase